MIKYFCDKCGVELNGKTMFKRGCTVPYCLSKEFKLYCGKSIKNVSLCAECRSKLESMRSGSDRELIEFLGKEAE